LQQPKVTYAPGVVLNVCPAAVTRATPDRVWGVVTASERFADWTDATFVSAHPPGSATKGQVVRLRASGLGPSWPVTIEVGDMDPNHRWIDLIARLPLGLENREHLTLTATPEGGTLVRFN